MRHAARKRAEQLALEIGALVAVAGAVGLAVAWGGQWLGWWP